MNKTEFVESIKQSIIDYGIKSIEDILIKPPGRSPAADYIERSNWFNSLSEEDKNMTLKVAKFSISFAIFNFFCVLDGVDTIEDEVGEKGIFKLFYEHKLKGEKVLLNGEIDPEGDLHDILKSLE